MRLPSRAFRVWLTAFFPFLLVFATTAHWWTGRANDTQAADWAAWALAHGYGNDLTHVAHLPANTWFIHVGDRLVATRTAGVVLAGVPMQWLLAPLHVDVDRVGVLTACLMAAAAMANVFVLLHRLGGTTAQALAATSALALGTSVWTVASAELWTHTPNVFFLSLLLLAWERGRYGLMALLCLPLLLTRPHLAVSMAVIGIFATVHERRLRPVLLLGLSSVLSLGVLALWNRWMLGKVTIAGGVYEHQIAAVTTAPGPGALESWATNVAGTFVSPLRGILLYSPFVVLVLVALVKHWRETPSWTRAALAGGVGYEVVQLRLNDFVGGGASFGNRLVLELLVLSAPAGYLAYRAWAERTPGVTTVARALVATAVATQLAGALFAGSKAILQVPTHPWTTWLLLDATRESRSGWLVLTACLLAVAAVAWSPVLYRARPGLLLTARRVPAPSPETRRTGL